MVLSQTVLVVVVAAAALLTGSFANYVNYGVAGLVFYALVVCTAVYLIVYQIRCVVHGACHTTAWWNAVVGAAAFASIAWYYYTVLREGRQIAALPAQPVFGVLPASITNVIREILA